MKNELDPFRVALGVLSGFQDSDLLIVAANLAGLRVNLAMSPEENYSHKTRVRALITRMIGAYEVLDDEARLAAARSIATNLGPNAQEASARIVEALAKMGWAIQDGELVATTQDLREMFFPKGSPWDAFVVLRELFAQARAQITIVDSYADGVVFQLLATRPVGGLAVRILCSQNAAAIAVEGRVFAAQHPGVAIEVRSARDFHDRFVVLDGQYCVHIGASIRDAGKRAFMISRVEDGANRVALLASIETTWQAAPVVV